MGRLAMLAASAALALTAMVGCAAAPTPPPTPSSTTAAPVFASEEEALAAATEAYAAYQAMSDTITAEGGFKANRIEPYATEDYYPDLVDGFEIFEKKQMSSKGGSKHDTVSLTSFAEAPPGRAEIDIYLCSDVSAVRLFDAAGQDITPPTRPNRIPLQVRFVSSSNDPRELLIEREDVWGGTSFC